MDLCKCYKLLSLLLLSALLVVRASCETIRQDFLECYKCTAYDFEEDFDNKLSHCESGKVEETVQCPYEITWEVKGVMVVFELEPSCTVVKQKAAGAVTSYTRGCKSFTNCTEINRCGKETDESGACISCCYEDLCNTAPASIRNRLQGFWTLAAILVVTLVTR